MGVVRQVKPLKLGDFLGATVNLPEVVNIAQYCSLFGIHLGHFFISHQPYSWRKGWSPKHAQAERFFAFFLWQETWELNIPHLQIVQWFSQWSLLQYGIVQLTTLDDRRVQTCNLQIFRSPFQPGVDGNILKDLFFLIWNDGPDFRATPFSDKAEIARRLVDFPEISAYCILGCQVTWWCPSKI